MIALLLAGLLAACGGSQEGGAGGGAGSDRLHVVTTTTWHTDLVETIGGDAITVDALMGTGIDPHLYKATAGDVEKLSRADVAVWNGLNLEGKLGEVFENIAKSVPVVTVGENVPEEDLIPIEGVPDKEFDPHIWFDPEAWLQAAEAVAEGLSTADPENEETYRANLEAFRSTVERTTDEIREIVESIPERSRVLVTSHDAFSYFARAFGFEVAPIQGKSTATEATTADIERVAETVADARLKAVFIESSVPQQTIDAVLASAADRGQKTALGGQLFGDALGNPDTPEGSWAGAVLHNARTVVEGLGGRG